MGFLIRSCKLCGHFHGRGTNRCMEPRCGCTATLPAMPNKPKTTGRNFRISDDLYRAAQQKAAVKGETVTDVVRRALERYVKRP